MAWTYNASPGTSTASKRLDAVRWFVGDTDTNDQQIQDAEITFALDETGDNIHRAGAIVARAIAASYARLVDVSFDSVRNSYSQLQDAYESLAAQLDRQAKLSGGSLGTPIAGGISIDDMDSVTADSDRPTPAFRRRMFENPSSDQVNEDDTFIGYHR